MPLWKLFGWFRSLQLWATGDWWLHHDNAPAHASHLVRSFYVKHQITQVTQPPYSPNLVPCDFWLFPKLKSPLKEKRFQTTDEIWENMTGINPHSRICLLILGTEGEEREREREVLIGCLPYAPQPGIEPATLWCMGLCSYWATRPRQKTNIFLKSDFFMCMYCQSLIPITCHSPAPALRISHKMRQNDWGNLNFLRKYWKTKVTF